MQQSDRSDGPRISPGPEERGRLIALIEEATVDAHDESEQALGLYRAPRIIALPPTSATLAMALQISFCDVDRI